MEGTRRLLWTVAGVVVAGETEGLSGLYLKGVQRKFLQQGNRQQVYGTQGQAMRVIWYNMAAWS